MTPEQQYEFEACIEGLIERECLVVGTNVESRPDNYRTYTSNIARALFSAWMLGREYTDKSRAKPAPVIDSTGIAVVDTNYHWRPMSSCPLGAKVQVLGIGGTATHTVWDGKVKWDGWTPLPTTKRG